MVTDRPIEGLYQLDPGVARVPFPYGLSGPWFLLFQRPAGEWLVPRTISAGGPHLGRQPGADAATLGGLSKAAFISVGDFVFFGDWVANKGPTKYLKMVDDILAADNSGDKRIGFRNPVRTIILIFRSKA